MVCNINLVTKLAWHVAPESPQVGVAPSELRQTGIVEVLMHCVAEPHLQSSLAHVLELDKSHKDVAQRHWHIPKVFIPVRPEAHDTPSQGSEIGS